MDWFPRKVVAWHIPNTLEADFRVEALNEELHRFGPPEIMNSDQGPQFTSFAWTDRLKRISALRGRLMLLQDANELLVRQSCLLHRPSAPRKGL